MKQHKTIPKTTSVGENMEKLQVLMGKQSQAAAASSTEGPLKNETQNYCVTQHFSSGDTPKDLKAGTQRVIWPPIHSNIIHNI